MSVIVQIGDDSSCLATIDAIRSPYSKGVRSIFAHAFGDVSGVQVFALPHVASWVVSGCRQYSEELLDLWTTRQASANVQSMELKSLAERSL